MDCYWLCILVDGISICLISQNTHARYSASYRNSIQHIIVTYYGSLQQNMYKGVYFIILSQTVNILHCSNIPKKLKFKFNYSSSVRLLKGYIIRIFSSCKNHTNKVQYHVCKTQIKFALLPCKGDITPQYIYSTHAIFIMQFQIMMCLCKQRYTSVSTCT